MPITMPWTRAHKSESTPARLPKLCGGDIELSNSVLGTASGQSTGWEASRALLREIDGLPRRLSTWSSGGGSYGNASRDGSSTYRSPGYGSASYGGNAYGGSTYGGSAARPNSYGYGAYDAQDWGRKWLLNGSCAYIDLDHLEICLPECSSAGQWLVYWYAMLDHVQDAMVAANDRLAEGQKIRVLANNTDHLGNSYGGHLNFLLTRRCWDNVFRRRIHYALFLMSYQISSIIFTGQGRVGSEWDEDVPYQLTQRGDFMEELMGVQTTFRRPILNLRDEPLCGPEGGDSPDSAFARLHVIFYDTTLCPVSTFLKIGVLQVVMSLLEAERLDPDLILDEPLEALNEIGHDPDLNARVRVASGARLSAVEIQLKILALARKHAESGGLDGLVPDWPEILDLWEDTLLKLEARDWDVLSRRLDWVLKRSILDRVLAQNTHLDHNSSKLKLIDLLYASLDTDGLYRAYEDHVERPVPKNLVRRAMTEPPEGTRAWTRGMLLKSAGPDRVDHVDWDRVTIRHGDAWSPSRVVSLTDPLGATRVQNESLFTGSLSLDRLIDALDPPAEGRGEEGNGRRGEPAKAGWPAARPPPATAGSVHLPVAPSTFGQNPVRPRGAGQPSLPPGGAAYPGGLAGHDAYPPCRTPPIAAPQSDSSQLSTPQENASEPQTSVLGATELSTSEPAAVDPIGDERDGTGTTPD